MVSHTVNYCITIQMIYLHVCTVIFWLVVYIITCLDYEILDVVSTKYAQCPIIKLDVMAIIENHLGVWGEISTHGGKIGHGFMPTITIHIS